MSTIGIDIGSGCMRIYQSEQDGLAASKQVVSEISRVTEGRFVSQSSQQIWNNIVDYFESQDTKKVDAICVTATCSMVVQKKVKVGDTFYLENVDTSQNGANQDIIMWMDSRPEPQTSELNQVLDRDTFEKLAISKKLIPELGIPKLKWVSDEYSSEDEYICFELHDWIAYLLLVGKHPEKIDGRALRPYDDRCLHPFGESSRGMDGSIKGWSDSILKEIGIGSNVKVGHSGINLPPGGEYPPIGTYLGNLHPSLARKSEPVKVINGCIDCYAGWVSTITHPEQLFATHRVPTSLSMIAGTSTCFVMPVFQTYREIPGIWGPFNGLFENSLFQMYEFGQPATGLLFQRLFDKYLDTSRTKFDRVEELTQMLEKKYSTSINKLIRYYFYYGDVYGNRSPYNDFKMSEMSVQGDNSTPWVHAEKAKHGQVVNLVIEYNLTLEFLAFQTKQLIDIVEGEGVISDIVVCGSQGKNTRFLQLLANVTRKEIVKPLDISDDVVVARGAATIAAIGRDLVKTDAGHEEVIIGTLNQCKAKRLQTISPASTDQELLQRKYMVFKHMALQQQRYRRIIDGK